MTDKQICQIVGGSESSITYMLSCDDCASSNKRARTHAPCQQWQQVRTLQNINCGANFVKAHCDPISGAFHTHHPCHMPLKQIVVS